MITHDKYKYKEPVLFPAWPHDFEDNLNLLIRDRITKAWGHLLRSEIYEYPSGKIQHISLSEIDTSFDLSYCVKSNCANWPHGSVRIGGVARPPVYSCHVSQFDLEKAINLTQQYIENNKFVIFKDMISS